jgi:hypothetical protein
LPQRLRLEFLLANSLYPTLLDSHFKECLYANISNNFQRALRGERMEKRKLDLVFIDKNGKVHPIDDASSAELAEGLEKISKEIAKRLVLVKEQR